MKRENFEQWEEEFIELFKEKLQEEPFYPYEHLWRNKLPVKQAFESYLKENEDYAEKFCELTGKAMPKNTGDKTEELAFLKLAKEIEVGQKNKKTEAILATVEKTSKYCPECGRKLEKKKICKCGYSRP